MPHAPPLQASDCDLVSLLDRARAAGRLRMAADATLALAALRVRRALCVADAALRRVEGRTSAATGAGPRRGPGEGGPGGARSSGGAGAVEVRLPPLEGVADGGILEQVQGQGKTLTERKPEGGTGVCSQQLAVLSRDDR